MEYSSSAIPYGSTLDAGTKEMIEAVLDVEIVSSADLVQAAFAVLTPAQLASHRRARRSVFTKDAAFAFIGDHVVAPRNDHRVRGGSSSSAARLPNRTWTRTIRPSWW
ncbi:MAG: hypothetical protein R3A10_22805 [Caldilineaceae bacterium]